MLGFIGGIFELLKTFGYLLVGYFINKAYYSSIIMKLYHIEAELDTKQSDSRFNKDIAFQSNTQNPANEKSKSSRVASKNFSGNPSVVSKDKKNIEEELKCEIDFIDASNNKTEQA